MTCLAATGMSISTASPELRAEVAGKIRDEGMSVAIASATYGYSSKAIYAWLREGVVDDNLILENNGSRKS